MRISPVADEQVSTTLFDRWAGVYDRIVLQASTYRPVHDAILRRIDHLRPSTVVDLGCGTGQLTERLVERFPDATVVGVDLSTGMLARAARRLGPSDGGSPSLVRADAGRLPLPDRSVDLVVCTESFHWYPDQVRTLEGLAAILRPGGRVIIASIATVTDVGDRMLRRASTVAGNPVRAIPPHRLRHMLDRTGFRVEHQRRIPRVAPLAWPVLTDARRP